MIFKKILLGILFLFSINIIYSYTNISSCQEINSSYVFDTDREIRLNQNISTSSGNCIEISESVSDFTLNCEGYSISSQNSVGFSFDAVYSHTNISVNNCKFQNSDGGVSLSNSISNFFLNNSHFSNITQYSLFIGNNQNTTIVNTNFSLNGRYIRIGSSVNISLENTHFNNFSNRNQFTDNIEISNSINLNINGLYVYNTPESTDLLPIIELTTTSDSVIENVYILDIYGNIFGTAIISLYRSGQNRNILFDNININTTTDTAFEVFNDENITLRNSVLQSGTGRVLTFYNALNSKIENVTFIGDGTNTGLYFVDGWDSNTGGGNNILVNSTFINLDRMIVGDSMVEDNLIYGNIFSNNNFAMTGSNNFSFNGIGNRYLNLNETDLEVGGEYCITPTNCDFFPLLGALIINQQASSSLFPFGGILITLLIIISYLTIL